MTDHIARALALSCAIDYTKYQFPFVKNKRLVCGNPTPAATAFYAGVKADGTPNHIKTSFVFEAGTVSGTAAIICNPNGLRSVKNITDRSLHMIVTNTSATLWLLGNNLGTYYYATIFTITFTTPIPLDGITEVTADMTINAASVNVVFTYGGHTQTGYGTFTDSVNGKLLSDFIGPYCTIEHFCTVPRNTVAMPQFTYWSVMGTGFEPVHDWFQREDGALGTAPTGQTYVQMSNVYNNDTM